MILLQGHAVTLAFKAATQMLCATHRLNMVVIPVKIVKHSTLKSHTTLRKQFGVLIK